jgi:xylulose-5-phosphate/fructose-6-phosphate phosphoketolase
MNQPASIPSMATAFSPDLQEKKDAYWRTANYLSVGQIYLQEKPLLETRLRRAHIKPLACKSPDPCRCGRS